jgi:hypothetical protein
VTNGWHEIKTFFFFQARTMPTPALFAGVDMAEHRAERHLPGAQRR